MSLKLNERYPARFNNPTAGYPQGSFKNRTTPTAKDGSYLEKDWANDKEGFFQSLLSAAGITANGAVDAVGASQFFDALQSLKQIQSGTAFTTAGSGGALTLTPTPAITAYSGSPRFQVTFNAASGATPTLNISGLGAKNLKQYTGSGTKIAATFTAGQIADVVYDGTDLVILDRLPVDSALFAPINSPLFTGTPGTASTPPLGDNGPRLANTNFVYITTQLLAPLASPALTGTPTSTTPTSGDSSTKISTTSFVSTAIANYTTATLNPAISNALAKTAGYNRTYVDLTASRSAGTAYTNSNAFPIMVVISVATQPGVDTTTVQVGSTVIFSGDLGISGMVVPVSFMVGNGQSYAISLTGGATIQKWVELT